MNFAKVQGINPNTSNTIGNTIYIIFADLQAYPKGKIAEISTYEESTKNDCELILLVVDSCYATIYCKDKDKLELLYKNARDCGFEDVEYITNENDTKTRLSVLVEVQKDLHNLKVFKFLKIYNIVYIAL